MSEVWILGATGRTGRAVAAQLVKAGLSPVLVGRDARRLREIAAAMAKDLRIVVAGSVDAVVSELSRNKPAVVVNTIGPFTRTALPIAKGCAPGTHYVDLSNELPSIIGLLELHDEAIAAGQTLITGAGFGVLATESVVLKLCQGQPPAMRVRVDAIPAVESEPGPLGEALAATIIDGLAAGSRQYANDQFIRSKLLSDFETLTLPDGSFINTASGGTGELEAARRASGASFAISASSLVPGSPVLRALLPPALTLLKITALRNLVKRQVAAIKLKPKAPGAVKAREFSRAHARIEWGLGARREGWLRTGDAMVFTADVMAEVAMRLARGEGQPGSYTPGALFGPDLATDAGGRFFLD